MSVERKRRAGKQASGRRVTKIVIRVDVALLLATVLAIATSPVMLSVVTK